MKAEGVGIEDGGCTGSAGCWLGCGEHRPLKDESNVLCAGPKLLLPLHPDLRCFQGKDEKA